MLDPHHILKKVWGYDRFRPMQEDIINAVLAGDDVLALLPTGGGKSVCFQVPALCMDGMCIVISPLIALMKDQVEQLKRRGIAAQAIYSGMSYREIDIALSNAMYGKTKFLYVSPERLKTEIFTERVGKMPVSLVAIDEAHCISQWGYDFRPPYLQIAELRNLLAQKVPFIALTATATKVVKADIQEKLHFEGARVFQKSFSRPNLSYSVRKVENKEQKLVEILHKVPGTAVVYVRNRKRTAEIAQMLRQSGISADYYHAGLDQKLRSTKQDTWIANKVRVIVATNAFGMGIDKADVRLVAHMDLPDSLEAYYQEAGRAGRDEKKAFAVAIIDDLDTESLIRRFQQSNPGIDFIRKIYQCLSNQFKIAVGAGQLSVHDFSMPVFIKQYQLPPLETYSALQKLEQEGFIMLNDGFNQPSKVHVAVDNRMLYEFQIKYANFDLFIKSLLRVYGGELFSSFVNIEEEKLGRQLGITANEVAEKLNKLQQQQIIHYEPRKEKPSVTFLTPRYDANRLPLNMKLLKERTENEKQKIEAVINYIENNKRCRTQQLLEYFDEVSYEKCRVCDVCVQNKGKAEEDEAVYLRSKIEKMKFENMDIQQIKSALQPKNDAVLARVLRSMLDSEEVVINDLGMYSKE